MTTPLIGIAVSALCITLLSLLFHIESARGQRYFESFREFLDRLTGWFEGVYRNIVKHLSNGHVRQILHFSLHTILVALLKFLKVCERSVYSVLRSNRTLAYKAEKERTTKSMFDEIAEHKASVALSEEERRRRLEESLNGQLQS